jgi:hypothetical protein
MEEGSLQVLGLGKPEMSATAIYRWVVSKDALAVHAPSTYKWPMQVGNSTGQ